MTTVLVTRPGGSHDPLVADLESRGYQVIAVPTVVIKQLHVEWPDLEKFDWAVVTSAFGAATVTHVPAGPRWAAVGEATARALETRGIRVDLVPPEASGPAIAAALPDPRGRRVLLVRGSLADPDLPVALRSRGALVEEITTYDTVEGPPESAEPLREALSSHDIAAVLFASGSAVRGFLRLADRRDIPAITIGPRTTAVARDVGFRVIAEAEARSTAELAVAVERAVPLEVRSDA